MIFGLGPVLQYELVTTSRRARNFAARFLYGLLLLLLLMTAYGGWEAQFREWERMQHVARTTSAEAVRAFAEGAFIQFGWAQGVTLLCLVPALVAGVIADEYQRKTLHYLLASRLSSAEIVLGKLGARLVHVAVFVAIGLPVVCMLGLYGALNPVNLLLVYGTTFLAVFFATGLSILVSILAKRPRDAILAAYALEFIWLVLPQAIAPISRHLDGTLKWVGPVNDVMMRSNPVVFWGMLTNETRGRALWGSGGASYFSTLLEESIPWMIGIQLGLGSLFLLLAIVGLRPLRGSSWPGGEPRKGWFARLMGRTRGLMKIELTRVVARSPALRGPVERPPCGEHPMLWKERYTTMGGGLSLLGSRPVVVFLGVLMTCYLFDVVWTVVMGRAGTRRVDLGRELLTVSHLLFYLGLLTVAASAAVSITGEREQDTWTSLGTTLLTPREVVHAKLFGAVWSARWLGLAILLLWAAGMLLGALNPLGAPGAVVIAGLAAWAVAALGVFVSFRSRTSTRALIATILGLLVLVFAWEPAALSGWLLMPADLARPYWMAATSAWVALSWMVRDSLIVALLACVFGLLSVRRLRLSTE